MNTTPRSQAASKGRILVVDDAPETLRLLLQLLTTQGYIVHTAISGKTALQFLQSTRPDLVLMDILMPEMDGYEVCKQLKADEQTHDLPIIFISGVDQPLDKVRAFHSGAVDYIVKPFETDEVLARIETHLALANFQKYLEQRVRERTAELAEINTRLQEEIVERKHAERTLREQEARIRRLIDANIIGVFFWKIGGEITEANDAFLNLVGRSREDLASGEIHCAELTPLEWRHADLKAADELDKTGRFTTYEKEFSIGNIRRVPVLLGGAFFEESKEQGVGFVLDLTERKRAEDRIRHIAQHDTLTGLPNRALFQARAGQAIAQAHRKKNLLALLFIDLDNFKDINDSLGHQVGDSVLRIVAKRLQRLLREGDTVARLGGDEFVISLPELAHSNDSTLVAQKALAALRLPFVVCQHELYIKASIGISLYPIDGADVESLMGAADAAMYFAKASGRNNYQFFTPALNKAAQHRLTMANQLHQAFERGEFMVHYQPQVNLENGQISGAEALIRWNRPSGGMIEPNEFIPVAEETGLIASLGEWILRQACEELARWRNLGYEDLLMAVNLSPNQLRRPNFPELVSRTLQETKLPGSALEIEITESIFMSQSEENIAALETLAGMGIRLSIDDFGTGYSSLAYLRRFPIHALKIDQSFVSGIEKDANDTAIVAAIIAMARSLNLGLIAEGVETIDEVTFLKGHGCMNAQGFYFSAPIPGKCFIDLLQKHNGKVGKLPSILWHLL